MMIFCSPILYCTLTTKYLVNRSRAKKWQQVLKCLQSEGSGCAGKQQQRLELGLCSRGRAQGCRACLFLASRRWALPCDWQENAAWIRGALPKPASNPWI